MTRQQRRYAAAPRRSYAPIELEPEAPVAFDPAPAEPARPRLTELDPAALPPLKVEPEE